MKRLKCNSCQKCWYVEPEDLKKTENCPYCGASIGNENSGEPKEQAGAEEPENYEPLNSFEELVRLTQTPEEPVNPVRTSKEKNKKKHSLVPLILILIVIAGPQDGDQEVHEEGKRKGPHHRTSRNLHQGKPREDEDRPCTRQERQGQEGCDQGKGPQQGRKKDPQGPQRLTIILQHFRKSHPRQRTGISHAARSWKKVRAMPDLSIVDAFSDFLILRSHSWEGRQTGHGGSRC